MEMRLGGLRLSLRVIEEESFESRSTGKQLKRLKTELMVRGDAGHDRVEAALSADDPVGIEELENEGGAATRWRILEHWYSYTDDGSGEYSYSLKIEQQEEIAATAVSIAGLRVVPYDYSEESSDGTLMVQMRAIIAHAEQDRLLELKRAGDYVEVIREGVNERPELMRLGRCLWSSDEDSIRQEINLVDRAWDEAEWSSVLMQFDEPFRSRAQEQLSMRAEQIERLVEALVETGVLPPKKAEQILGVPDAAIARRSKEYMRVRNLDSFLDETESPAQSRP